MGRVSERHKFRLCHIDDPGLHLALCREFYTSGASGPWWRGELDAIELGVAWCDRRLNAHGEFRYQLRDFELHALR